MIDIKLQRQTIAGTIKGVYESHRGIDMNFIPIKVYFDIVDEIAQYLPMWDYENCPFELWVTDFLTIAPIDVMKKEELVQGDELYLWVETEQLGSTIVSWGYIPVKKAV